MTSAARRLAPSPDQPLSADFARAPLHHWCENQCGRCGSSIYEDDNYLMRCASGTAWCYANPLPGRETVACGTIEWFCTARCDGEKAREVRP